MPQANRLGVGLAVILLPLGAFASEDEPARGEISRGLDGWSALILVAAALGLVFARRYPGTGVVALMILTSLWYQLGHTSGLINPFVLVAFYKLGSTGDRRRQFGIGVPAIFVPLVGAVLFSSEPVHERLADLDWPVSAIGWPIVAMLLGEMVLNRQQLLDEYARRAETAEAERDAEAERRVTEERLRIARDVHDVLAHTVAVMHVQAGAAADTLDRDPEATRRSLTNIRTAGKEAMNEVRATVAVLREGTEPSLDTGPAPGLGDLETLVETTRRAGLDTRLTVDVAHQTPDSLTELTAYRIAQEALTNVRRHALDPSVVEVKVTRAAGNLLVEVTDDGRPTGEDGTPRRGFGLQGMKERVEPLGGTLQAGPRPGGGWRVRASLPLQKAAT
jgi:signal transduction histidine kinase